MHQDPDPSLRIGKSICVQASPRAAVATVCRFTPSVVAAPPPDAGAKAALL
jgi:hypothetical protein